MSWSQPICERCWIEAEGEYDLTLRSDGVTAQTIVRLRMPVRVTDPQIETCAWCGAYTILGAYKRADPAMVPFPSSG